MEEVNTTIIIATSMVETAKTQCQMVKLGAQLVPVAVRILTISYSITTALNKVAMGGFEWESFLPYSWLILSIPSIKENGFHLNLFELSSNNYIRLFLFL